MEIHPLVSSATNTFSTGEFLVQLLCVLCSIYKAIRLPRKHWSCKSQWHQCADTLRKHPSRSIYNPSPNRQEPILWKSHGSSAQTQCAHILAAAIPMRFAACHNHCFANHNGSNAQSRRGPSGDNARRSPFWRLWVLRLPLQRARGAAPQTSFSHFTLRLRTGKNQYYYGNHNGSSAQTQCAHILAAAITMRFAACHNHCFANHNGSHAQSRRGPSGDNARRSPFWRLWVLRLPLQRARGAQRRQRAPQPLLEALGTAPASAESEGSPAATTRAAAPSGGSGYCACHCRERGGPSGDNARRSPFWRLWVLRLPLQRARGAQRRQRAPQPLLEALGTAPATAESEGGPAATTRAAAPSGGSGYCACHCRERGGPSGDNARRRPFWTLWVLRVSEWTECVE